MTPVEVLYQTIWLRSGRAYIPTIARPPSGVFFEVEPVEIIEPVQQAFVTAVRRCLSGTFVRVRERDRFVSTDWPMSVVQKAAGFRSWRGFARQCLSMALIRNADKWQVSVGDGGADEVESVVMPMESSVDSIAEIMAEISERHPQWKQ